MKSKQEFLKLPKILHIFKLFIAIFAFAFYMITISTKSNYIYDVYCIPSKADKVNSIHTHKCQEHQ